MRQEEAVALDKRSQGGVAQTPQRVGQVAICAERCEFWPLPFKLLSDVSWPEIEG